MIYFNVFSGRSSMAYKPAFPGSLNLVERFFASSLKLLGSVSRKACIRWALEGRNSWFALNWIAAVSRCLIRLRVMPRDRC
jgi:hypothetical protein